MPIYSPPGFIARDGPRSTDFVDILVERAGQRMYVEAKGWTAAPGLDVDTIFGQLLRRMPPNEVGSADFAVVVRDVAIRFVLRVPKRVRDVLRIRAFSVAEDGTGRDGD